jgi:ribA/ribD-fused uncharacterized protein
MISIFIYLAEYILGKIEYKYEILMKYLLRMTTVFPFFKSDSPFSNWWMTPLTGKDYQFISSDGTKYICTEQWMMAEKARLFNDPISETKIMTATNPKEYKRLGRLVKNFKDDVWNQKCRQIMYDGLLLKFSQHPIAKKALIDTGNAIICEASPYDEIWGVKLGPEDPRVLDPKQWKGTNFLGYELMNVRKTLTENKL